MGNLNSALERMYQLIGRGQQLGLESMTSACEKFGHPEKDFEVVHVAGTNGKGTVCAFLSSMHIAAGEKVGLYTSPHLNRFAERIRIDGEPIADEPLAQLIHEVLDTAPELTFFEATTLIAFLAFSRAGVKRAMIEVGLGGRLDATNVIPAPRLAIITRISFDHMDQLGDSISAIAKEKAAIIKPDTTVITGRLHPDALEVVEKKAQSMNALIVPLKGPEPIEGAPLAYPRLSMIGTNLAVAVTAGHELGLTPEQMARGIETLDWPGRNELLHRNRKELTLLDCAHNPDGALTLSHTLDPQLLEVDSRKDIALVFGTIEGKNYRAMLQRLAPACGTRFYCAPPVPNAQDPQDYPLISDGEVCDSVQVALARARDVVGSDGVVVVTGSIFLVGAARAILLDLETDPAVSL